MTHILEGNLIERARFNILTCSRARAAWRRAVEATTGGLPSWAQRKRKGIKPSINVAAAVALYNAGGVTLKEVGEQFGIGAHGIGYHVLKAKAALA